MHPPRISTLKGSCPEAALSECSDAAFEAQQKVPAGVFPSSVQSEDCPQMLDYTHHITRILAKVTQDGQYVYQKSVPSRHHFLGTHPQAPFWVVACGLPATLSGRAALEPSPLHPYLQPYTENLIRLGDTQFVNQFICLFLALYYS